ncbi:3'(2'),5'-bisphosphate nucleotidase CysQ [Urechidicola sp. KH5]
MLKTDSDLKIAIKASLHAGKEIMAVYDSGDFNIEFKGDNSPLTIADKRANEIIVAELQKTGMPIISEENKQTTYSERKIWSQCWIVDPLDGTKEFIKRNGEFTVNIALVEEGMPILGVIYAPVLGELFFGDVKRKKAYKILIQPEEKIDYDLLIQRAIEIKPTKSSNTTVRIVGSRSHMNQDTLDFIVGIENEGKKTEVVSIGSSLKLCLLAEGRADIYPRFAPTMEWDTAAGHAICKAVGLEVVNPENNNPLTYNKDNLLNPYFICK